MAGTQLVILVDRGFIPMAEGSPDQRKKYAEPGVVSVSGILLRPHVPRYFGVPDPTLTPNETRLDAWNAIRLDRIQQQVTGSLLPVYLLAAPDPASQALPYRAVEKPDLSEGSHMGYAMQWFSFAAILGLGYPFFVRKQLSDGSRRS
jgi:surfeit locus 1 family protein